jgi:hypothetical protein
MSLNIQVLNLFEFEILASDNQIPNLFSHCSICHLIPRVREVALQIADRCRHYLVIDKSDCQSCDRSNLSVTNQNVFTVPELVFEQVYTRTYTG